MLKYVLKQFFNNKKSFILSVLYIDLIENNLDDINLIRDIVDKME